MRTRGFTLIELLVVIAIIAILAAILFPVFARVRGKAEQAACATHQRELGGAIMMYLSDYDSTYPWSWTSSGADPTWAGLIFPYVKSLGVYTCPTNKIPYNYLVRHWPSGGRAPRRQEIDRRYSIWGVRDFAGNAYVLGWLNDNQPAHGPHRVRYEPEIPEPANVIVLNEALGAGTVLHYVAGQGRVPEDMHWWWAISDECWSCWEAGTGDPDLERNQYASLLLHNRGSNYTMADGHVKWFRTEQTYLPLHCSNNKPIGNKWQWDLETLSRCTGGNCRGPRREVLALCR